MKEALKVKGQKMQQEREEQISVSTKYRLWTRGCRPLFSGLENNGTIVVSFHLHAENNGLQQYAVYFPFLTD